MTPWILGALGLWLVQVFFAAGFKTVFADNPTDLMADHMRAKDKTVEVSKTGGRAMRARDNYAEALPIFIALALLLEIKGAPGLATTGAAVFLLGRALYLPAYLAGIYGLRTSVWTVGHIGLAIMAWAALQA